MIASRINILLIAALAAISAFAQFPQAGVEPIGMTCRQAQGLSTNVQTIRTSTYVVDFSRHVIQQGEFLESVERNYNAIGQLESERSFDADGNKLRGTLYQYRDSNLYVSTHLDAQGQRQLQTLYAYTADGFCARMRLTDAMGLTISTSEISHTQTWSSVSESYNTDGESVETRYEYNKQGYLVNVTRRGDVTSSTTFSYGFKKLPTKMTIEKAGSKETFTFEYETNTQGDWTVRTTYKDGTPVEIARREITYFE
ncbi:MAG: hypothetical protein MJZ01_06975 [Bacteroidales bacterium]|nr:hypothetical protein [Bacteroidales bacterium]